jgi:hypothetical protein
MDIQLVDSVDGGVPLHPLYRSKPALSLSRSQSCRLKTSFAFTIDKGACEALPEWLDNVVNDANDEDRDYIHYVRCTQCTPPKPDLKARNLPTGRDGLLLQGPKASKRCSKCHIMAGPEPTTGIVIEGCGHVYHRSCVVSCLFGPYLASMTMRKCRYCKNFKAYAEKNGWDRSVWRHRFGDADLSDRARKASKASKGCWVR